MAINTPVLGIGVAVSGLAPLFVPIFEPAVNFVAQQASNFGVPTAGVYIGIGAIITALGTAILQPYFKERGTAEKLAQAQKQIDENSKQIDTMKSMLAAKEARVDELVKQLSLATESNSRLADRLFRTSGKLLEVVGKIKPLTEALRPVPMDTSSPRHTVLLLEDDDDARIAMAGTLDLLGFDVTAVETLMDARDAIGSKGFDAAVVDLMVPDGDGAEILRVVRQRGLPTRVVVTTGRSEDSLAPVYALKPDYLFRKPVDIADVVAAIRGPQAPGTPAPTLAILPVAAANILPPPAKP